MEDTAKVFTRLSTCGRCRVCTCTEYCDNLPARELPGKVVDALRDVILVVVGVLAQSLSAAEKPTYFSIFKSFTLLTAPHNGLRGWDERDITALFIRINGLFSNLASPAPIQRPGTPAACTSLNVIQPGLCGRVGGLSARLLTCHQQSATQPNPAPASSQLQPVFSHTRAGFSCLTSLTSPRAAAVRTSLQPAVFRSITNLFSPVAPRDCL